MSETKKSKIKLGAKIRDKLHIPAVARKPWRDAVSELMAQAMRLPQTKEIRDAIGKLDQARVAIYGKVKTGDDEARQKSVDKAKEILDEVRPIIERVAQEQPKVAPVEITKRKASKEDEARAKQLLKQADEVAEQIAQFFEPHEDRPNVLMPQGLGRMDLLGQLELMRLHVGERIVDERRAGVLQGELQEVRDTLAEAQEFTDELFRQIKEYDCTDEGVGLLQELSKRMQDVSQTPLAQKVAALRKALHPDMNLLNAEGIDKLAMELLAEINLARQDLDAYAQQAGVEGQRKQEIAREIEIYDALVNAPLEDLRQRSEALTADAHIAVIAANNQARLAIVKPPGDVPGGEATAGPILQMIEEANNTLEMAARELQGQIQDLRDQAVRAIAKVKDTEGVKVYAVDWRAITGLLNAVNDLIPAPDARLDADTMGRLATAMPLISALTTLADQLEKDKATVADFDHRLDVVKQQAKTDGKDGEVLPKYFPSEWKSVSERIDKLEKGIGTAKARDSAAALDKLAIEYGDLRTKGQQVKAALEEADELVRPAVQFYVTAQLSVRLDEPNAQLNALHDYAAEAAKTPPDPAALKKLSEAVSVVFFNINTPDELYDAVAKSHKEEKQKEKNGNKVLGNLRRPLENRLYALKLQFDRAEDVVDQVKGDTNQIDQIDRMFSKVREQIDGITLQNQKGVAEAEKTLDRIQRHIDLVLAYPEGEVNRKRSELPGLYEEYRKIRAESYEQLQTLDEMFMEYVELHPDAAHEVQKLQDQFKAYAKAFAKGHNNFAPFIAALSDKERPEGERRKAREAGLAAIAELERGILSHPLTEKLAKAPLPGVRGVPRQLINALDRLNYTILTCVK